ncbi:MAG: hypothetical protein NTV79_06180 [Candidatus Aureabacteria bacterium]|nr:hypothetical protein [Candidatus Auribacterota bacterium]
MINFFNILSRCFDLLLSPFRALSPFWGLAAVSLLTAIFILLVYRFASNQEAIRREKKRIQGHFLGIYLFKDSVRQIFLSLGRLLLSIARYLAHSLPSLLIVIVPILLVCVQLDLRYGRRGLEVGESVNVGIRWSGGADPQALLQGSPGLIVETPPVRIAERRETDWRVRVEHLGDYALAFAAGKTRVGIHIVSGKRVVPIFPETGKPGWRNYLLAPGDDYLSDDASFRGIFIDYPHRRIDVFGLHLHWAIVYFALAIVFGFILKRPLGVEF